MEDKSNIFTMKNKIINCIYIFSILILTSNCSVNPSTGKSEFVIMSESEEDQIGKKEHPKIIKSFGGIYKNEQLQNYVESLGYFLVNTSELSNKKFTFTILNSPIVNAFALPGGYIYLTRGLIYLCQNEAQLAGVIAHEIGHVTARHTAKRYTKNFGVGLLANILGVINKNMVINDLVNKSASLYLLSFSRSQEYEADRLAVRYMARAGFDPNQMGEFLRLMEKFSRLKRKIVKDLGETSELLKTHPNSSKRVKEVIKNSKEKIPFNPITGSEVFLKKIDGMIYGEKPEEGFFVKNTFIHKKLDFSFSFSKSFYFLNNPNYLLGITDRDTKIFFDIDKTKEENTLQYLSEWIKVPERKILNYKSEFVNNYKISSGLIKRKKNILQVFAISDENLIYRFVLFTNKNEFNIFSEQFEAVAYSFERVSSNQKLSSLDPPKIRILRNLQDKKFISSIKEKITLQTKYAKEIFETINDLENKPQEKEKIKLIY